MKNDGASDEVDLHAVHRHGYAESSGRPRSLSPSLLGLQQMQQPHARPGSGRSRERLTTRGRLWAGSGRGEQLL